MTQRYAVPEGMLKSALDRVNDENVVEPALEAACRWLSENPIVPTDEQLWSIGQTMDGSKDKFSCSQELIEKWQRRMFVVPEPESAKCPKQRVEFSVIQGPKDKPQADNVVILD